MAQNGYSLRSKSTASPISYLETWVGTKKSFQETPRKTQPSHPSIANHGSQASVQGSAQNMKAPTPNMTVTGQTFLVPTIKLPRSTTPSTLHQSLANAMGSSPAARNLLSGRGNGVPLVVDLGEFVPDGSPHFKLVQDGELASLLKAMKQNSLYPIAITSSSGTLPNSMERIATEVGLPSVMRSASSRGGAGGTTVATLEEMFKVVSMRGPQDVPDVPSTPSSAQESVLAQEFVATQDAAAAQEQGQEQEIEDEDEPVQSMMEDHEDPEPINEAPPSPSPVPTPNTKIYEGHVRSGQQVSSSENGNLVIIGNVSSGGELVSDGDIHVYGRLRGRALAGLGGGTGRIYASSFDPELVCLGGVFTTLEGNENDSVDFTPGGPTMAYLSDETGELRFAVLK